MPLAAMTNETIFATGRLRTVKTIRVHGYFVASFPYFNETGYV